DLVYRYENEKWDAVVDEIVSVHETGQPILIGTSSVEKSEKLAGMLKRRGVNFELLNAKPENVARESEIVAQAGRKKSVTIATNMAGRGTDIILGGNPETMAWAQLRHEYPTRLDVPEDVWKAKVEEIERAEKMTVEGREVAGMGGLHIVGTERHDSRRIDNQLRGRSGRQGDPGTARFFLSLQDDLMRIYGGERMARLLTSLGMKDGEAIESRMVTRQIEKAQKKVEEQHFEARKNLLEYDEVMDHQRKKVYGFRQHILDGKNGKLLVLDMLDEQIGVRVDELMADDYGPASFAEFAANRLGVEFEASQFKNADFEQAAQYAKDKASRNIPTVVQEALDENLPSETDESEWQWQALAGMIGRRYDLKLTDRELKKIGRDELPGWLIEKADEQIQKVDLSDGAKYLQPDWGLRSVCDWVRLKFRIEITPEELAGETEEQIQAVIRQKVRDLYRQKEIEFPVQAAIGQFLGDKTPSAAGPRYDRAGLFAWSHMRFPDVAGSLSEEEFRTQPKSRLQEIVLDLSRKYYPTTPQEAIDDKLAEALEGAEKSDADDAAELVEWFKTSYRINVPAEALTGVTQDAARQILWNAFDNKYRPEMRGLERSLLLARIDDAWKKHLLTMDHLRSGIGLVGYAQVDPKTEYKREGMKAFDEMWNGVQDKITEAVFRMEEEEGFQEVVGFARHEEAPRFLANGDASNGTTTNAAQSEKKPEPIRNATDRVGRNDPCPCGSGKKYKNCHMRQQAMPGARR
ncbi:MAG TPA: SEC-C metal-binding domain-containing protein, partial [Gemmataceae bacterium]|nr:SEC-C metal-binding domain-containing protein [Gemmataceae bacterium]